METLSVKAGILASLFGIPGIIGLAILLVAVVWLVVRVANFDSVLPSLLVVLVSVALIAAGLVSSPAPDYQPEPLRTPWDLFLDWAAERAGSLLERRAAGEGEASPEDGEAAPEDGEAAPEGGEAAPEGGEPAPESSGTVSEDGEPDQSETMDVILNTVPAGEAGEENS